MARSRSPEPRTLLGWMYLGRICLALLVGVVLVASREAGRGATPGWLLLAAAVLFTALSYGYSLRRPDTPPPALVYGQLGFDTLLVTLLVYLTGGQQSIFASLYVLVICAAALLLPLEGAILTGLFASVLYVVSVARADPGPLASAVLLQAALFAVVALVTGYLGDRLRRTGEALGEVESELRLLRLETGEILDAIGSGILTVDGSGRLAYINPAAAELLSLAPPQWVGRPVLAELDRIAPGLGEVISRSAASGTAIRRFETEPLGDGSFVLGVSTTLMERPEGEPPPVTAIFQDITERKRAEALRLRAERLEAVAELSASLAHEIRNPLASIRSAVEQITSGSIDAEDSALLRALVLRESDRLSRLLSEFIDFARVKVTEPQPVELPALVRNAADLVRAHPDARGRTIEVAVRGAGEGMWVRGAEDVLHRAMLNLLLNAVQWAGEGGRVLVTLDEVSSDLLSPALGDLTLLRLRVADSGPGVDEAIAEHIFDPFVTRRAGGTGLGLALVQRAVEAHGGAIFVNNAPASSGLGATFTLYLPVLARERTPAGLLSQPRESSWT